MLIYIECLSCRELWPGDAILDAVDGSLPQLNECMANELCPECLERMRDQSDPPDSWMPALDAAFEKQYSAMSWQQMRQELDLPVF